MSVYFHKNSNILFCSLPKFECDLANVVLCLTEFFILKDTSLYQNIDHICECFTCALFAMLCVYVFVY